MDILYIVGKDSQVYDFELRCSLRSIYRHGRNVGRVYVVGNCPEWLSDKVVKLPVEDINEDTIGPVKKAQNIASKLLYAIDNSDIGEEFLVSMDDHFYTSQTDFDEYPFYIKKAHSLNGILPSNRSTEYSSFLADCKENLEKLGLPTFYFTLHRNMRMIKSSVIDCRATIEDFIRNDTPFEVFALIGNYQFKEGLCSPVIVEDNRINNGESWWRTSPSYDNVFSTGPFTEMSGLYQLLRGLYPNKSVYEK